MIIPVRCFTCGKPINDKYTEYKELKNKILDTSNNKEEEKKKIFDSLGIHRYCCRRMITSHVELIKEIIKSPDE